MRNLTSLTTLSALLVLAGCGGFGGGGGGGGGGGFSNNGSTGGSTTGGSTATTGNTQVSAALLPTNVTRSPSYTFSSLYQPSSGGGAAVNALTASGTSTANSVWLSVSPIGAIDKLSGSTSMTEMTLVFDVRNFATGTTNVLAATADQGGADTGGQVWSRDSVSGQWLLALDTSAAEAVVQVNGGSVMAFSGQGGGDLQAWSQSGTMWSKGASAQKAVPTSTHTFNSEVWVGGRQSDMTGGPARLFHGNGLTEVTVPYTQGAGNTASVTALAGANNVLYVGVEEKDPTGATVGGGLFGLDATGTLQPIATLSGDGVTALAAADGTIYAGTRKGTLQWLDTTGKLNTESTLPANSGVTSLLINNGSFLIGVATPTGGLLYQRSGSAGGPSPTPSPTPTGGGGGGGGNPQPSPSPSNSPPPQITYAGTLKTEMAVCITCHKPGGQASTWDFSTSAGLKQYAALVPTFIPTMQSQGFTSLTPAQITKMDNDVAAWAAAGYP